jgi:tight adherence protein B
MPSLGALSHFATLYAPVVLFAVAVFLGLEVLFGSVVRYWRKDKEINARLSKIAREADAESVLIELRRGRGLTAEGSYQSRFIWFNRLIMQSGLSTGPLQFGWLMLIAGLVAGALAYRLTHAPLLTLLAGVAFGVVCPLLFLKILRARRVRRFEELLPEAIDVIVRSLRAGHPVPVAIAMVGREMPDPIGSEFGMASDEMTYGMDLDTALGNMRIRAGQSDLAMLAVAVSIQSKSGGNLAEILTNLSRVVRERAKLRRKIHALSAEGRFSAIALSVIPVMLYLIVNYSAPHFYADVRNDPLFMPAVYLGIGLWVAGMLVMRRMVNFRF